jgi:hypothetical protein
MKFATVGSLLLWVMLYRWMRLFPETAFFVKLISSTIIDMKIFILFIIVVICAFACQAMIFDRYYTTKVLAKGYEYSEDNYDPLL